MTYRHLKNSIEKLREKGEPAEISMEMDWKHEIGGGTGKAFDLKGPVLPSRENKRLKYTPLYRGRYLRFSLALGLPAETTLRESFPNIEHEEAGHCEKD